MSLNFKKTFGTILRIKKILDKEKDFSSDAIFDFLEVELASFIQQSKDKAFISEVLIFLKSPHSKENFDRLVDHFKKRRPDFLKKQIFLVFGKNKEHFKSVKNYVDESDFECDWLDISNPKGGTKIIFPTLIEKISSSFKVIVILSADDIGKLNNSDENFTLRPRLNVVLEAGLSFGILDMDDVLLLWDERISTRELISDFGGCFTININESNKWKNDLMKKLEEFAEEWEKI